MAMAPKPFGGVMPFLQNNSNALLGAGIGLLSGRTANEQAAMGLQGFSQGRQENKTKQWVMQNAPPEIAQAVEAGVIDPAQAFQAMTQAKTKKAPIEINGRLVDPETYQVIADFSDKKPEGGNQELGLNLVWGKDKAGNTIAYQPSKTGGLVPVTVDEGVQLTDPYNRAFDAASGKVQGETQATAQVNLDGARRSVQRIDMQINDLKNDPGLEKVLGPLDSITPDISSDAVRARSKINQIGGQAFLEARQMLKGGGAITDFESARAEAAYARLAQAQDPADFKQALDEFNQAVKDGYAKIERQAMGSPMPNGTSKRRVYNPATGNLE